jgi:hypothetical protein
MKHGNGDAVLLPFLFFLPFIIFLLLWFRLYQEWIMVFDLDVLLKVGATWEGVQTV